MFLIKWEHRESFMLLQRDILFFFNSVRTPVLDKFFSIITNFGDVYLAVPLMLFIIWCIDRKKGVSIALALLGAVSANTLAKAAFSVPRPWVVHPELNSLGKIRATGPSFPSGHSATASSMFISIFLNFKRKGVRFFCILICLLVLVSRMYMTVHWPMDVAAGLVIGFLSAVIAANWACRMLETRNFNVLMVFGALFCIAGFVSARMIENGMIDALRFEEFPAQLGMAGAAAMGISIEETFFPFSAKGPRWKRLVRYLLGLAGVVFFMAVTKKFIPATPLYRALRYSVTGIWATALWPYLGIKMNLFRRAKD